MYRLNRISDQDLSIRFKRISGIWYKMISDIIRYREESISSIIQYTSKHRDDQFSLTSTMKDLGSSLNSHVEVSVGEILNMRITCTHVYCKGA